MNGPGDAGQLARAGFLLLFGEVRCLLLELRRMLLELRCAFIQGLLHPVA
jgi:hypothetical protein